MLGTWTILIVSSGAAVGAGAGAAAGGAGAQPVASRSRASNRRMPESLRPGAETEPARGREATVAVPVFEGEQCLQHQVEAHFVGPRERTFGIVGAQAHSGVDGFGSGNALAQREV